MNSTYDIVLVVDTRYSVSHVVWWIRFVSYQFFDRYQYVRTCIRAHEIVCRYQAYIVAYQSYIFFSQNRLLAMAGVELLKRGGSANITLGAIPNIVPYHSSCTTAWQGQTPSEKLDVIGKTRHDIGKIRSYRKNPTLSAKNRYYRKKTNIIGKNRHYWQKPGIIGKKMALSENQTVSEKTGLFTVIRPYTVRFSEIENPTVRFGLVVRKRKSYGAVRCGFQIL